MMGWLQRWQQFREARTLARRAIPDPLWQLTLARLPYLGRWPEAELIQLRRLSTLFLAEKEFTAAGGLQLDDSMAVYIAAQACLPILRFGLAPSSPSLRFLSASYSWHSSSFAISRPAPEASA